MAATADVAGEKVGEARKRLAAALERAKEIAGNVRDKAVAGAKATDEAVHEHPYQAIAIGVGVGAIIGYLLARRCSRNRLDPLWKNPPSASGNWPRTSKTFVRRLVTIGENRLELLAVEVQEERERLLHAFLLALGVAAFGLLAGLTLTAAIVVLLWAWSPVAVLLILTGSTPPPGFVFTGGSPDCCATGRRFPPRSINSERTAHVWKKSST
jgi:ElaB/YqjD/DUF883 family membrane-anchored ribosome-binding protein